MSAIVHHATTLCPNGGFDNYTGSTGSNMSHPDSGSDVTAAVSIGTSLLSLVIVVGNGLIIISVAVVKKLRQPANYLIVSLALSDFLVGLIVLPLTIVYDIGGEWIFGSMVCDMHVSFDVICCTASIMNLCMISIDRYLMITKPMTYPKKRTGKLMALMIATAWLISCLIILPALFGFTENVKDSPNWLLPVTSSGNGTTNLSLNMTNDPFPSGMDTEDLTDFQNSNKTVKLRWHSIFDLGQPYKVMKFCCNIPQASPVTFVQATLQAEICDKDKQLRTAEMFFISSSKLYDEVYVTNDVIGQYVQITLKSSDAAQHVDCHVYGEKLRGKTCLISQEVWFTIYSTVGAFYLPLTVMLCVYWKIHAEASKFEAKDRKQSAYSFSQDYSESPGHIADARSMEGYSSSSPSLVKREISFNNNLADSKNSAKFHNSNSELCFSDSGDAGLLFNCCPPEEEHFTDKENEKRSNHINGITIDEDTVSSISDFLLREKTDLGSQTTCCGDSLTSRGDEMLSINLQPNSDENKQCFQCENSKSEPSFRSLNINGLSPITPSSDIVKSGNNYLKCLQTRALSANNITLKTSNLNDSNFLPNAPKLSRLCNGISNGDGKFPPISEHNVLEIHSEAHEPTDNGRVTEKSELLQKSLQKSDTNDSISSDVSTKQTSRAYITRPRYSIFSASSVYGARPQYCRHSISSNRNVTNGAVPSYTKRRQSVGVGPRRTSSTSKVSHTGSDSISRYANKKMKMLNHIRRRVSGATSRERMRNVKATRTLGIIVGVFTFCWMPFFMVTFLRPFVCEHPEAQDCIPLLLVRIVLWLGYVNSALNPLIYIGFSVDLRKSFCYLLSCKCKHLDRRLAQHEFRRAMLRERQDSFTSHQVAAESIM